MFTPSGSAFVHNRVLSALKDEEYHRLAEHGEEVTVEVGTILYEEKQPIRNVEQSKAAYKRASTDTLAANLRCVAVQIVATDMSLLRRSYEK